MKVKAAKAGCSKPGNESIMLQNEKGYWKPAKELLNEVEAALEAIEAYKAAIEAVADNSGNVQLKGAIYNAGLEFDGKLDTNNFNLNNAKRAMLKK